MSQPEQNNDLTQRGPEEQNLDTPSGVEQDFTELELSNLNLSSLDIGQDRERFRRIVKGKVREDLKKYMTSDDLIGRKDGKTVKVPIKGIETPHFKHGSNEDEEGVGQGDGEPGDPVDKPGDQPGEAGDQAGEHMVEEISIEELAQILGEELELPRIEPKGTDTLEHEIDRYTDISRVGPDSLRHNKRTIRQALIRQISEGTYDPDNPQLIPYKEDFRYRAPDLKPKVKSNAAIIYIMDVSGSMGEHEKEMARITSFWINAWLDTQYEGCEKSFIIHDAQAQEVDEYTFFHTSQSGGTRISSAYTMADEIIRKRFPPDEWNIYVFQFSDGDNWGDDGIALEILGEKLLPYVNLFGYTNTENDWGSGQFGWSIDEAFGEKDQVVLTNIKGREDIPEAIKDMLGKGR